MHRHLVIAAALLALVGAGCSSDPSSEPAAGTTTSEPGETTSTQAGGEPGALVIVDFAFEPPDVLAGEDGTLTITNEGDTDHTFTMDDGSIDEDLAPGATVDVVIGETGGFHCEIHPSMTGTVESE
ncbi:MAG TPA: cupredoxin domain-containing protein [Actinomycetota bacterium]|nr:cupredoxin domain-containing protein [Actinomycetota bacterium]